MKQINTSLFQIGMWTVGCIYATSNTAIAQVTSDGTVNTQVTNKGNIAEITGGETRGGNLFHSFQDFGGVIQTASESTGNAGNIELNIFQQIKLDGRNAPSRPSEFDFAEAILNNLEGRTGIFANAGNSNGGNIIIDTNFLIAFPNGNNDIIANARLGSGGNININAEALFGIQERSIENPLTNDIDASSEFSLDGNVTINTPDLNPLQGTVELPNNIVAPDEVTARACTNNNITQNTLTIKGKSGSIAQSDAPLSSSNISIAGQVSSQTHPQAIKTSKGKIQPARGVKVTESGEVILTTYRTNNAGERIPEARNCS